MTRARGGGDLVGGQLGDLGEVDGLPDYGVDDGEGDHGYPGQHSGSEDVCLTLPL